MVRQLHKLSERVGVEDERELVRGRAPAGHGGREVQVELESLLHLLRGLPEVPAAAGPSQGAGGGGSARQEVLHQPDAHVVAHLVQLLVHVVHVLVVPEDLGHQSTIGQTK